MPTKQYEFTTEDVEYLRHGDKPLTLRLYKPRGDGPFPAVIDLHGGAWTVGDLTACQACDETLARSGVLAIGLNFRHAGDGHLASMEDINYAIRWVKAHASDLRTRPDMVSASGQSSGGHLAMLAAMRPNDPRYGAIPLPAGSPAVDASLRSVGMLWPVINPLSRYRHALRLRAGDNTPAWVGNIPERHELYWKNEAAMAEGNPIMLLERGEKVKTPPALWIQGRPDQTHDYRDPESSFPGNEPERFAANYRRAGGHIDLTYIEQETRSSPATYEMAAAFFLK